MSLAPSPYSSVVAFDIASCDYSWPRLDGESQLPAAVSTSCVEVFYLHLILRVLAAQQLGRHSVKMESGLLVL